MLDNVKKHLEEKGVDPALLDDFAVEENVVEEPVVEVDALTEALDTLTKAMKKEDKPAKQNDSAKQDSLFDMDEEIDGDDDDDLERGYYRDAMKALAKGTDDVIAQMEKRMGAVMKGLEAILGSMKNMQSKNSSMEKSLNAVLNQSSAPRAVTSAPVVQAPAVNAPNRGDMIRKGLVMLQDNAVEPARKIQIRTAIAQLEAGVDTNSVSHIIG